MTDLSLAGKRVFIRVDFNVPIKDGRIGDDTRIRAVAADDQLRARAGRDRDPGVAPRPAEGQAESRVLRSRPVADAPVASCSAGRSAFAEDCVGEPAARAIAQAGPGGVVLLENLRFHAEEEKNDPAFAKAARRAAPTSTSTTRSDRRTARTRRPKASSTTSREAAAGLLMAKEVEYLGRALEAARAAVRRDPRRRQGLGQARGHREPARQGRRAAHRRRDGLHVPQGAGRAGRQVARRGRSARHGARRSSAARRQRGLRLELPVDHVVAPKLEAGRAGGDARRRRRRRSAIAWASTSGRRRSRVTAT